MIDLDDVRAYGPKWADRAARADDEGHVAAETAGELAALGAHRLLQPRRFGGAQATVRDHMEVVAAVGEGCMSAGWCLAVWSAHNWMIGLLGEDGQAEVWGVDPSVLVSASIVPRTGFEAAGDGVVVQGRFGFASGCDHADWIGVGGIVERDGTPEPVIAFLPRDRVEIDQGSWQVAGLRGTGSKDVVIDEPTEVPSPLVLSMPAAHSGTAPGQRPADAWLYRAPFRPVAALVLAAPVLGAARTALRRFVDRLEGHKMLFAGTTQREDPAASQRLSAASAAIDAAELVLMHAADELEEMGRTGDQPPERAARVLRDTAYGVRLCASAVDTLYEASGGMALQTAEPLQRIWRDVHAARLHGVLTWDAAAQTYGRAALG